jgi:hypothetical protein
MRLLIGAVLLVGMAAALVWLLKGPRSAGPTPAPPPAAAPITASSSPEDRFWAIVESSARHAPASDAQTAALRKALEALPVEQVESFERIFQQNMGRSYSWDLWGAAYVINGGASDDGFEYFRRWLISRGRHVFEAAMADPDSLADLLPADLDGPLEYEDFAYVAPEVWAAKTKRAADRMPRGPTAYPSEPTGAAFTEDNKVLKARYPKLWRRFGGNWLF